MTDSAGYHEVEWNPNQIQRFWDFYGANLAAHGGYFSRQFAGPIVRVVRRRVRLLGTMVDIGCGPGYLLNELLKQGLTCRGIDSSQQALVAARERLAGHPRFLGTSLATVGRTALRDGGAGAVFLIEVLEHLRPGHTEEAFRELRRVIAPGGHLIITVPNEESLDARKIACPECGCVFHRVQHVQSFSQRSLAALTRTGGFTTIFCAALNFADYSGDPFGRVMGLLRRLADPLRHRPKPHLLAIARRPAF